VSLQLTVDIKELYRQLCPECQNRLIQLVRLQPDEEMIRAALEGTAGVRNSDTKPRGKRRRK